MENKAVINVCITGAAGNIAYALYSILCTGQIFGANQKMNLKLLDIESQAKGLQGVALELEDCAYALVNSIEYGFDPEVLFKDMDVGIFLGGQSRRPGMERVDLLQVNNRIFKVQGKALNKVAKPSTKILVIANPVNTNCLTLIQNCPNIPKENFTCLTRLDHNRAIAQLAIKAKVPVTEVKNVILWGNHSLTMYPDHNHANIEGQPAVDIFEEEWIKNTFIPKVQKRGGEVLNLRQNSSVMSAAIAIRDHLVNWIYGTSEGQFVSMGVYTDGSFYDLPADFVFSVPVKCKDFKYEVVKDLTISQFSRQKINISLRELQDEKEEANCYDDEVEDESEE
ncbi:hypothetical protein ABPG74_000375 [Tetrahymena malaccensis]